MMYEAFINEQLTPHFKMGEFFVTLAEGGQQGLLDDFFALTLKEQTVIISNLRALAQALEHLRVKWGKPIHITSGWRSKRVNALVGGEDNSFHMKGMAADIVVEGMDPVKVWSYLHPRWGGGLGKYRTFSHVDIRNYKARWQG